MSEIKKKAGLPPLDWLKVFESAGRLGNFTAAAEEFGLSQAAISQRIRNLESWLARPLFIRTARGVSLTVEGESYLPLIQDALETLEQGTEDLFGQAVKELRLAALSSHLDTLVLGRLSAFHLMRPEVKVSLVTVPKRSEMDNEDTALQIRFGRGTWPGRQSSLLASEGLRPMVAHDHEGPWLDLPAIDLRGERLGWRDWAEATGHDLPTQARVSVDSMVHALRSARLGQGVVLGSDVLAKTLLDRRQLKCADAPVMQTGNGYWLTWPDSFAKSKKRRQLLDDLVAALSGQD